MYPEGDFQETEYVDAHRIQSDDHSAAREQIRAYVEGAPCSKCGLGSTPAERLWEEVQSANPSNSSRPAIPEYDPGSIKIPSPSEFASQHILSAIRPQGIVDHAIDEIREKWEETFVPQLEDQSDLLAAELKQLSSEWVGRDFDALEDKVNRIIKRRNGLIDDVKDTGTVLKRQEETIRSLQSTESGGLPLPPVQFRRVEPEGFLTKSVVHMRPPWHTGECYEIPDEEALDIMGIPRDFRDEIHQQLDNRAIEIMEQKLEPMSTSQLESLNEKEFEAAAYQEAKDEIQEETRAYEQAIQGDYSAEVDRIGDDIGHRHEQVDSTLADSPYARGAAEQSPETGVGAPELTQPPATSTPDASLMAAPGGIKDGSVPSPEDVANRPGGASSRPNPGWSEVGTGEEQELSDGLASGSGGPSLGTPGSSTPTPSAGSPGMGGGAGGAVVAPGGRPGGGTVGSSGSGRPGSGPGSSRAGGTSGAGGRGGASSGASGGRGSGRGGASSGASGGRGSGRGMGGGQMGMMGGPMGGAAGQQGNQSGRNANRQTLGQMGRTTNNPTAPPAGSGANRGGSAAPSNAAGSNAGARGAGSGGVGLAGGGQNRNGGKESNSKGKRDNRTVGSMGRPPVSSTDSKRSSASASLSTSNTKRSSKSSTDTSTSSSSKLKNLISAAKSANEKRASKSQNPTDKEEKSNKDNKNISPDTEENFEELDIHEQQIIEDDLWGAYNKRFDQYR